MLPWQPNRCTGTTNMLVGIRIQVSKGSKEGYPHPHRTRGVGERSKLPSGVRRKTNFVYSDNPRKPPASKILDVPYIISSLAKTAIIYYPNVTTLRSGICYRKSVCLSATFVHPAQLVEIFGNVTTPFCILAIRWRLCKILRRSSQGNPSVEVACKMGSQI